ncbi:unnamed protein product [Leuciscus chuanchicus]
MGDAFSQEVYDKDALHLYEAILQREPHLLPDVGIDESLLKYSGSDSNAVLQAYSEEMLNTVQAKSEEMLNTVQAYSEEMLITVQAYSEEMLNTVQAYSEEMLNTVQACSEEMLITVPGYVSGFGSAFGPLTSVPNAVGLGALVISLLIEIAIKASTQTSADTYSLLRRVFWEEKASGVRDTISEYLKRHELHMNNNQRLWEEIRRLEQDLSKHLTILRNSLLYDGQMSSRGFNIWVNGAAFHVQMLIHEARLDIQADPPPTVP